MKTILRKIKNMKYRHKLTLLMVTASLVPMTLLALYNHATMSSFVRENELEDTRSILEQTQESIDSQIAVYSSLLNYLTYSPDIKEVIETREKDKYLAYERYTEVVDPLLTIPKSYHDALRRIQLFADSIEVRHDYTLIPLREMEQEWWNASLREDVSVQWIVDREIPEIVAVRKIYDGQKLEAVLCIALDYDRIFQPLNNVITSETGGVVMDGSGEIIYRPENPQVLGHSEELGKEELLEELRSNYVYVNQQSGENHWVFYLYKSKDVIEKSVFRVLLSEIPLIIMCVVIIFILGLSLSRLFTRKIEQLTENMNRVNHGSREVTVYSDAEDEVGLLIRSFRRMMGEIDRLIHEVYENKIALKEFELKALTAQINPHFLYNSLSIINWMAIKSKQPEISRVTLALSTFYRTALSKGADMVTVESCIKNIEAYLQIQLVMHDNDFRVEWEIEPQVKAELVPKLILQPVVENALEHGLDMKEEGEKILKLFFGEDGENVLLRVTDNGLGMEQSVAESLVSYQAEGYGLKNVNDRICLLYGEEYAIRIFSRVGEGTIVEMRIPKGDAEHEK